MTRPERVRLEVVRYVGEPVDDHVQTRRHHGKRLLERYARRNFEELVAIEREHEVSALAGQEIAGERGEMPRLEEASLRCLRDGDRQPFGLELRQNVLGAVERSMVDDHETVEHRQVV